MHWKFENILSQSVGVELHSRRFSKFRNMSNPPELKIKGLERKLKQSEVDFMKLIEEQNITRVLKLKRTRKNNLLTGNCQNFESFRHPH